MAAEDAPLTVSIKVDASDLKRGTAQAARAAQKEIDQLKRKIDSMSGAGPNNAAAGFNRLKTSIAGASSQAQGLQALLRSAGGGGGIGGAFIAGAAGGGVAALVSAIPQLIGQFSALLDTNTKIQNSLKLTGLEGEALAQTYGALGDSAQKNGANFEALAQLYSRVGQSQKELGINAEQAAHFVDGIAVAIRVAGTSSEQSRGALLQLSQALGAGAVRGDEFNSIMEGLLPVMQTVASGLGVSVGALKKLAFEGKLTSKVFLDAFTRGQSELEARAGQTATTISQSWENVYTATIRVVNAFDELTGASGSIASFIQGIADGIGLVATGFEKVSTAINGMKTALDELGQTVGIDNLSAMLATVLKPLVNPAGAISDVGDAYKALTPEISKLKQASDAYFAATKRGFADVQKSIAGTETELSKFFAAYAATGAPGALDFVKTYQKFREEVRLGTADAEDFNKIIAAIGESGIKGFDGLVAALTAARDELGATAGDTKAVNDAAKGVADAFIAAFGPETATLVETLGTKLNAVLLILQAMSGNAGSFFSIMAGGLNSMPGQIGPVASEARDLIKQFEGFRTHAYWDVNHWRVGFGSDKYVDAMGNIKEVTKDTVVTLDQANKDLDRRISEFQAMIVNKIGPDMWASFSKGQQAALTSITYNYGELPDRIARAIKTGDAGTVQRAIAALGSDNGGGNRARRQQEADLFGRSSAYGGAATGVGDLTEAQRKENEVTTERLKLSGQLTDAFDQETYDKVYAAEVTKNMAAAEEAASKRGKELSDEEIAAVKTEAAEKAKLAAQEAGAEKARAASKTYEGQITDLQRLNEEEATRAQQLGTTTEALIANLDAAERKKALDEAQLEITRRLNELTDAGVKVTQAQTDAITQQVNNLYLAKAANEQYSVSTKKAADTQQQFADQFTGVIKGAVSGFISDLRNGVSAGEAFSNMLDKIIDGLINMALEMLFSKQMMGALFGGGGGGGIGAALGLAKGGFAGRDGEPILLPPAAQLKYRYPRHFSSGGWASGIPAMLHPGELVVPRNVVQRAMRGSGPGSGYTDNSSTTMGDVNIDMGPSGLVATDTDAAKQWGENVQRIIRGEMVRESRPGGLLRQRGVGG